MLITGLRLRIFALCVKRVAQIVMRFLHSGQQGNGLATIHLSLGEQPHRFKNIAQIVVSRRVVGLQPQCGNVALDGLIK